MGEPVSLHQNPAGKSSGKNDRPSIADSCLEEAKLRVPKSIPVANSPSPSPPGKITNNLSKEKEFNEQAFKEVSQAYEKAMPTLSFEEYMEKSQAYGARTEKGKQAFAMALCSLDMPRKN